VYTELFRDRTWTITKLKRKFGCNEPAASADKNFYKVIKSTI